MKKGQRKKKFMQAEEKIPTSTVMFIPSIRNGILIKALKEAETEMSKITRFKVRFQEAGWIQVARLFSSELGKGKPCGRYGRKDEKIPNCKQAN